MKELKEISNKRLIQALINERRTNLNSYTPLSARLKKLERWVETNVSESE